MAGTDVVVLASGEELTGSVLVDNPGYVEIRVGADTTIGLPRSDVREVRRGAAVLAGPPMAVAAPPVAQSVLAAHDDWYVLHDGEGRCVGTLHWILRADEDGSLRLAREWEFHTDRGRTQVTELETLRTDGTPLRCFYHERTQRPGEQEPRDERLVRGEYDGGQLRVVRTSIRGSERSTYEVGKSMQFPLVLRELLRQRPSQLGSSGTRLVYDPARDDLRQVDYTAGERRRVELEGAVTEVREASAGSDGRRDVAWVDGHGRCVRFEVNGAALVAVATKREVGAALVANRARAFPAAVLREADDRFSLWLPNPIWRFERDQVAGQITAQAPLYDASVSVLVLDQVSPNSHLGMAADAVERLLRAVCRDFRVRARRTTDVRREPGMLLDGTYQRVGRTGSQRCEMTVLLTRTPDGAFLASCLAVPAAEADALRPDFERMVETLELHAAQVAAEARGQAAPPSAK